MNIGGLGNPARAPVYLVGIGLHYQPLGLHVGQRQELVLAVLVLEVDIGFRQLVVDVEVRGLGQQPVGSVGGVQGGNLAIVVEGQVAALYRL